MSGILVCLCCLGLFARIASDNAFAIPGLSSREGVYAGPDAFATEPARERPGVGIEELTERLGVGIRPLLLLLIAEVGVVAVGYAIFRKDQRCRKRGSSGPNSQN